MKLTKEQKIILGLVATIIIGGISAASLYKDKLAKGNKNILVDNNFSKANSYEETINSEDSKFKDHNTTKIYVHIEGEIESPGVYKLKEGSRIKDLVEKAGGLTIDADTMSLNQAKVLYDEDFIIVPKVGENVQVIYSTNREIESELININTADALELSQLSGIGEAYANRIIEYRESNGYFQSIEELKNVSGIGDSIFENIKEQITIGN